MKDSIKQFINKQTCVTVCCADEQGNPYCFSCFYAFDEKAGFLFYKSSMATRHSTILLNNSVIAGTILPDKLNFMQIKGIQLEGIVLSLDDPQANHASSHYYKKHPMALAIPGEIWTIQINTIKFTDNSFGLVKKISWNRNELIVNNS
ncbi:MAG: pyridoxamine 5'-phosphate oxidase family protein [Chitinophagaceae bacterium]|jgi:uncharacterized protein YhbP (UPF0306 family)|nr:pyridoxamine 5'-phosphate oxidase family protein [Chitinophagaceae bacterium]